jgi:hypothetical protein
VRGEELRRFRRLGPARQRLQLAEGRGHVPRVHFLRLQQLVAVAIGAAFLRARKGGIGQRLPHIAELRAAERGRGPALRRGAFLEGRGEQGRAHGVARVFVLDVANLVADNAEYFLVAHQVHQPRQHAHAAIGAGKGVHVFDQVHLVVHRHAIVGAQAGYQLLQALGVGAGGGGHGVVGIAPGYVFLGVGYHVLVAEGSGFGGFQARPQRGGIKLELRLGASEGAGGQTDDGSEKLFFHELRRGGGRKKEKGIGGVISGLCTADEVLSSAASTRTQCTS